MCRTLIHFLARILKIVLGGGFRPHVLISWLRAWVLSLTNQKLLLVQHRVTTKIKKGKNNDKYSLNRIRYFPKKGKVIIFVENERCVFEQSLCVVVNRVEVKFFVISYIRIVENRWNRFVLLSNYGVGIIWLEWFCYHVSVESRRDVPFKRWHIGKIGIFENRV